MVLIAVLTAAVASFVFSAVLYGAPPVAAYVGRHGTPRPGVPVAVQMGAVLLRSLVAAGLVAGLMHAAGWEGAGAGALLGLALGALPAAILAGAVVHEGIPVALAAIHAFDWVAKLVLIGALVGWIA
ncbi:Protein of unknown function [Glycomyces sambucus]|uniref:DUF1761 domain-containing protein n=1 Tax=Glycomyces sambucus TaxID=380244 RepID=A0A1G9FUL5_9ACTN|nr:DUF1761 family protein [Glycomyces sambucus]SDK92111.1 Protein of unknown function [Glycomyces sambucus]